MSLTEKLLGKENLEQLRKNEQLAREVAEESRVNSNEFKKDKKVNRNLYSGEIERKTRISKFLLIFIGIIGLGFLIFKLRNSTNNLIIIPSLLVVPCAIFYVLNKFIIPIIGPIIGKIIAWIILIIIGWAILSWIISPILAGIGAGTLMIIVLLFGILNEMKKSNEIRQNEIMNKKHSDSENYNC